MADSDQETPDVTEDGKPLKEHAEAFERMLIDNTMPRRTLNEKMAKYNLTRSDYVG